MLLEIASYTVAALGALAILLGWLYAMQFVLRYDLGPDAIRYKLFGVVTVGRIRFENIREARLIRVWPIPYVQSIPQTLSFFFAVRWPSYVFNRFGVLIQTTGGMARWYVLSPKEPEAFAREITQRLHKAGEQVQEARGQA